jgi:hypothetical protein
MISSMDGVHIHFPMELNMLGIGKADICMEKGYILLPKER